MFSQELIGRQILNLSTEERDRLFRILSDNVDIFDKIMPGNSFLEFISTKRNVAEDSVSIAFRDWKDNLE